MDYELSWKALYAHLKSEWEDSFDKLEDDAEDFSRMDERCAVYDKLMNMMNSHRLRRPHE